MAAKIPGLEAMRGLGPDAFLKLLLTKMKHKNPLEPRAEETFIAELAQFTALQQMINLNEAFNEFNKAFRGSVQNTAQTAALNMLGTLTTAKGPDGKTIEGLVTKITLEKGVPKITIFVENKEHVVGLEDVVGVRLY